MIKINSLARDIYLSVLENGCVIGGDCNRVKYRNSRGIWIVEYKRGFRDGRYLGWRRDKLVENYIFSDGTVRGNFDDGF